MTSEVEEKSKLYFLCTLQPLLVSEGTFPPGAGSEGCCPPRWFLTFSEKGWRGSPRICPRLNVSLGICGGKGPHAAWDWSQRVTLHPLCQPRINPPKNECLKQHSLVHGTSPYPRLSPSEDFLDHSWMRESVHGVTLPEAQDWHTGAKSTFACGRATYGSKCNHINSI